MPDKTPPPYPPAGKERYDRPADIDKFARRWLGIRSPKFSGEAEEWAVAAQAIHDVARAVGLIRQARNNSERHAARQEMYKASARARHANGYFFHRKNGDAPAQIVNAAVKFAVNEVKDISLVEDATKHTWSEDDE